MKADYINPFVTAAISTLKQFIPDIEIERGELDVAPSPAKTLGAAVYIGISGELKGRVIYDMDRSTAVKIASAMNQEELPGLNDMVRSTIQELGNIISGNASSKLHKQLDGKHVDITPPSMIVGDDTQISDSVSSKYLKVPLNTNYGQVIINVNIREN
ncbi:MAG: chemotaxis protein CheX [bacterium]